MKTRNWVTGFGDKNVIIPALTRQQRQQISVFAVRMFRTVIQLLFFAGGQPLAFCWNNLGLVECALAPALAVLLPEDIHGP